MDFLHEGFGHVTLFHETMGAPPQALFLEGQPAQLRVNEHAHFGESLSQLHGRFETILLRHAKVHKRKIRAKTFRLVQEVLTVVRRPCELEFPLKLKELADSAQRVWGIISN